MISKLFGIFKTRMLPEDARLIYGSLHKDLTNLKHNINNYGFLDHFSFDELERKGFTKLLKKDLREKLLNFYKDYQSAFLADPLNDRNCSVFKLIPKHNVKEDQVAEFVYDFVRNKAKDSSINAFNKHQEFMKELTSWKSDFDKSRTTIIKKIDELSEELSDNFAKDLMSLDNRRDFLQALYVAAYILLTIALAFIAWKTYTMVK